MYDVSFLLLKGNGPLLLLPSFLFKERSVFVFFLNNCPSLTFVLENDCLTSKLGSISFTTYCHFGLFIYLLVIYRVQVLYGVILNNVTFPNNLLLNSYFKNLTIGSYVLYVLTMHANFHVNRMLFSIWSINSSFIHHFKLQKLEFKQLIIDVIIEFWSSCKFASMENIRR